MKQSGTVLLFLFIGTAILAAQDGQLDVTFNSTGIVTTTGTTTANSVAIQSDGKIVVAGTFGTSDFQVARYTTAGALDNTFDSDGIVTTDFNAANDLGQSVAIQSDGKIVVAGYAYNGSNYDFAVARYNSNGSLDNTFDSDGKVTTAVGSGGDVAYSVAIQSDGKIVVAGYSDNGSNNDFAVVRYNTNGSLDNTFDSDGKQTTSLSSGSDVGRSVAIQSDGKIVVTGDISEHVFVVVRYNSNGSLDNTFDGDGITKTLVTSNSADGFSIAIQADGKIVVAGDVFQNFTTNHNTSVVRYNSNGTLDSTFDGDGIVITVVSSNADYGLSVALQLDGKIVVSGYVDNTGSGYDVSVLRYNSNGNLDNTFDSDGKATTAVAAGSGYDFGYGVALQSDGKIVVAGYALVGGVNNFSVVRYTGSSGPLPVEIVSLTASTTSNGVELNWNTATETNNYGFEIERTMKNDELRMMNWSKAGFVEGHGTTNAPKEYTFIDRNILPGKYLYRLKQIDRDGKFQYSNEVEVNISADPKVFELSQNYPNPFNPTTMMNYQLTSNGHVSLKVFDAIGREVVTLVNEVKEAGNYSVSFNASTLSSGIYFAHLTSNGKSQVKKLSLVR